jgi:hypothetical protein
MHQLGVLLVLLSAHGSPTAAPSLGATVVLKRPGTAVVKAYKVQPPEVLDRPKDVAFLVVEVEGDWLWIYTPRGMGWVQRSDVLLPKEAVAFFSVQIGANAQDAEAWGRRGAALANLGDPACIRDLSEAVRLRVCE